MTSKQEALTKRAHAIIDRGLIDDDADKATIKEAALYLLEQGRNGRSLRLGDEAIVRCARGLFGYRFDEEERPLKPTRVDARVEELREAREAAKAAYVAADDALFEGLRDLARLIGRSSVNIGAPGGRAMAFGLGKEQPLSNPPPREAPDAFAKWKEQHDAKVRVVRARAEELLVKRERAAEELSHATAELSQALAVQSQLRAAAEKE